MPMWASPHWSNIGGRASQPPPRPWYVQPFGTPDERPSGAAARRTWLHVASPRSLDFGLSIGVYTSFQRNDVAGASSGIRMSDCPGATRLAKLKAELAATSPAGRGMNRVAGIVGR